MKLTKQKKNFEIVPIHDYHEDSEKRSTYPLLFYNRQFYSDRINCENYN